MTSRLLRSALYIPALREKGLAKADHLGADAVIIDLEDSVAPGSKEQARVALRTLPSLRSTLAVIRVNGAGTPWHADDVAAATHLPVQALLLPKTNDAGDIAALATTIEQHAPAQRPAIWAMIETPQGVLNAPAIARALGPQGVIVMGLNDLARETGMRQITGRAPMLPVLATCLLAARAHGAAILDGVFNALDDSGGFAVECLQARDLGFDGKTLIHPDQIAQTNATFGPSTTEIDAARMIVAAFAIPANSGKGVIALNGRMVERLHHDMALALLEKAAMIDAREHKAPCS